MNSILLIYINQSGTTYVVKLDQKLMLCLCSYVSTYFAYVYAVMHVLTATARVPEKKVQIVVTPRPQPEAETKAPKKQRKKGETSFSFYLVNYKKDSIIFKGKGRKLLLPN